MWTHGPHTAMTALLNGRVVFIAGTTTIAHVECYDSESNEWFDATDMNINRSALSACVVAGLPNIKDYTYHGSSKLIDTENTPMS